MNVNLSLTVVLLFDMRILVSFSHKTTEIKLHNRKAARGSTSPVWIMRRPLAL